MAAIGAITQSLFTQSANLAGAAISVNVAGVRETGITLSICWQENIVETAVAEILADGLQTWFHQLGQAEFCGLC